MKPMNEYFNEMYGVSQDESLEHHGILGQKWGIRRYQNYDGTLKAAGKNRVRTDKDSKKQTKEERKAAKAAAKEEKKEAKAQKAYEKERAEIDDAIANVDIKKISELKSKMTDEDMVRLSVRAQALGKLGENLGKYQKQLPKSTGEKMLSALDAVKTGADAVKGVHKSIRELKEEFGLDNKSIIESAKDKSNQNGKKNEGDGKDKDKDKTIFDRVNDLYKDVNKRHQERTAQKEQAEAKRQAEDDKTLDWLKKITGSDKTSLPKANFDKGFKLGDGDFSIFKNKDTGSNSKPKANFEAPFKLKDGDTSVFKPKTESWAEKIASAGNITSVKLNTPSSSSKPSSGSRLVSSILSKVGDRSSGSISVGGGTKSFFSGLRDSAAGNTSIEDLTDSLLKGNGKKLGL